MEIVEDIASLAEWNSLRERYAPSLQLESLEKIARDVICSACVEPLTGLKINPGELAATSAWREGLLYRGIGSRALAVLAVMASVLAQQRSDMPAIYATEAVTPFALRMRGMFPRFYGSEFSLDPQIRQNLYPIPCEDLQQLSLRSDTFDIVSTNEVLEHVPSIDRALAEIYRILKPGGWHVGTLPFHFTREVGVRRASLNEQRDVVHLMEPEYHGDPVGNGALVFELPGWDIIDRSLSAGFSRSFMRFILSSKHGILAEHVGGVFVFCCQK